VLIYVVGGNEDTEIGGSNVHLRAGMNVITCSENAKKLGVRERGRHIRQTVLGVKEKRRGGRTLENFE